MVSIRSLDERKWERERERESLGFTTKINNNCRHKFVDSQRSLRANFRSFFFPSLLSTSSPVDVVHREFLRLLQTYEWNFHDRYRCEILLAEEGVGRGQRDIYIYMKERGREIQETLGTNLDILQLQ